MVYVPCALYSRFHEIFPNDFMFQLLFSTICTSVWDVMAYLICISLLFVGYMCFGYVVIGPYHVKVLVKTSFIDGLY